MDGRKLSGTTIDVLQGGGVAMDIPTPAVMVTAESDLANLPEYPAGTIAFTAGFSAMWQLSAAGNWVSMM
jgi:hypothetical protein